MCDVVLPKDPDSRSTSILAKEAAASTGINKRTRVVEEDELNVKKKVSRKASGGAVQTCKKVKVVQLSLSQVWDNRLWRILSVALRKLQVASADNLESESCAIFFLSGVENSTMFPKETRPPFLQDDSFFNSFKPEVALQAVMAWAQTAAMEKANKLKEQKVEKGKDMRKNTAVKMVEVKEGKDDATTVFHPQRFLRPPVVGLDKYWSLYPKQWEEKYYSVFMEDVGLQNELGQRQIELLHDRRSAIKVKMFAPANVNVGRSGTKTTNIRSGEEGIDMVSKDDWAKLGSLTDLEMSLDNLVAAYAVFWPGDRSMVTLRRVVTKLKSFKAISNQETRMRLLEVFINQVLEVNQRKACQDEVPLSFKEVMDIAKDKLENVYDYFPSSAGVVKESESGDGGAAKSKTGGGAKFAKTDQREITTRRLKDLSIHGKDYCIDYNLKGEDGDTQCKSKSCRKAHNCGFIPRGESKPCGGRHSKIFHFQYSKN